MPGVVLLLLGQREAQPLDLLESCAANDGRDLRLCVFPVGGVGGLGSVELEVHLPIRHARVDDETVDLGCVPALGARDQPLQSGRLATYDHGEP